jgi:hypothetical protein
LVFKKSKEAESIMQIALTKKLAEAIGIVPAPADEAMNPLFSWTANFTNTFADRKEDTVVLVNNATHFTVVIYGIKRRQFKGIEKKIEAAIRNTFAYMNINPEVVDEYFKQAGTITFAANKNRKYTALVNSMCMKAAMHIGNFITTQYPHIKYEDTFGRFINQTSHGSNGEYLYPLETMNKMLAEITDKPIYSYPAYELLVTLDLDIYKAKRRLIVPADIEMQRLHRLIQHVFNWNSCHLYMFCFLNGKNDNPYAPDLKLAAHPEDMMFDEDVLMDGHRLNEFIRKYDRMVYVYDFGDDWTHEIKLIREIPNYNDASPRLLKAIGQTPPEDVGGPDGYADFYRIMTNPDDPAYAETKDWVGYWSPELSEWRSRPGVIEC